MKRFSYILSSTVICLSLLLMAPGCNLEETNLDPTRPSDVDLRLQLPNAIAATAKNQSGTTARIAGIVMQQFIGFDAQQVAYTNYNIPEVTFNNYWRTGTYAGALKDCQVIIDKAIVEEQPYYEGIAKILMAENYGLLAAQFGDVPFSDALRGTESLKPVYDSQEAVFAGVQSLLDEGIELMSRAAVPGGPGSDDLIYGGDADGWIATARALKARYFMMLTRRSSSAATDAMAAINSGAVDSKDAQPDFAWETAQTSANPIALFGVRRPNTLNIDPRFAEWMEGNADPRQPLYMGTIDSMDWQFYDAANTTLRYGQLESVIPIISFAEVQFIRAEAMYRNGSSDADVTAALADAINASFEEVGIDPASAEAVAYVDARSDVSGLDDAGKLERIMEEAYVGQYGLAFVSTWTNFRRTGYPVLTPDPNGTNGLNTTGEVPRRWIYPVSEAQTNSANLEAAITNQGGALLSDDTWAFKP